MHEQPEKAAEQMLKSAGTWATLARGEAEPTAAPSPQHQALAERAAKGEIIRYALLYTQEMGFAPEAFDALLKANMAAAQAALHEEGYTQATISTELVIGTTNWKVAGNDRWRMSIFLMSGVPRKLKKGLLQLAIDRTNEQLEGIESNRRIPPMPYIPYNPIPEVTLPL
jgi:hypothetical protein